MDPVTRLPGDAAARTRTPDLKAEPTSATRSRRWIEHLRAPLARVPRIAPVLRAYGGLRVRDHGATRTAEVLGRLGTLEVRLARTAADVRRAQRLRFDVFYREMSAVADAAARLARRDVDPYDALCDHLLVDHATPPLGPAERGRHLSAAAPDVGGAACRLLQLGGVRHRGAAGGAIRGARFLELGRSACCRPIATGARWSSCGTASGAMCCSTGPT
jgi:hypothetical protein